MRAFPLLLLAFIALAALSPEASSAAIEQPCRGGISVGVYHAYSECQVNRAGDRVWFVVTDHYYSCPPNNTVRKFRVHEIETSQPCDRPAPGQNNLVRDLGPGDQSPQADGEFIFLECINGFWHRVHYQRHRLPDGSVRISRPATALHNTLIPCERPRPPVVAGVQTAATTAQNRQVSRAPTGGAQGTISGVVVGTREDRQGDTQLLLQTPTSVSGTPVDEIRVQLPAKIAKRAEAEGLPNGWKVERGKGEIVCSGPPVTDKRHVAVSLKLGQVEVPDRVSVKLSGQGRVLFEETSPVTQLPKIETATSLDPILRLPQVISPGEEVDFTPLQLDVTPAGGDWTIGEVEAEPIGGNKVGDTPRYRYTLPHDWDFNLRLGVRYTDPWGETLVEAEATETEVKPSPDRTPGAPLITGCTPKAFFNATICVCGWFPDPSSRSAITLNGKALGEPVSATNRVLNFRVPEGSQPGDFQVGGEPSGGFTSVGEFGGEFIQIGGFVDQDKLMRGESTSLRLWIEGTEDALPIQLVNNTPGIASVEGGEEQVATTSGGTKNDLERNLHAITPGRFHLIYTMELDSCPCAGEDLTFLAEDGTPVIEIDDIELSSLPEEWTTCDRCIDSFRRGRDLSNQADDAQLNGQDPTQLAQDALKELKTARDLLEKGKKDGSIGEYTSTTLDRLLTEYETQARDALDKWQIHLATTVVVQLDDDGDDPRDTPPPVIYGEEIDNRVGILLVPSDRHWVPDPKYKDKTILYAKIYEPDPTRSKVWLPSDTQQRVMTVRFASRSNEKGMSLNADLPSAPQDSPDLFIYKDYMPGVTCTDDPTGKGHFGSCTTTAAENELAVYVKTEDYGSFSKMEALCADCVPLVGVPMGDRARFPPAVEEQNREKRLVRVPSDGNDNQIADGYPPEKKDVKRATDDDESSPTGNGTDGDGFSAYEEYRGFMTRYGFHRRSDWNKKTLVIYNMHNLPTNKFETQSQLQVIEVDHDGQRGRVANYNAGHAKLVDQHCLKLKRGPLPKGVAGRSYGFGPPKNVQKTVIRNGWSGLLSDLVAHEVGHSVGMRHHGDPISHSGKVEIRPMTSTWRDLLPGYVHSGPSLCGKNLPAKFSLGKKGDQASGHIGCLMRYEVWKEVYQQTAGDFDCMPQGLPQPLFCNSSTGTGVNRMGRTAGDATRGDCKGQIIVNDKS